MTDNNEERTEEQIAEAQAKIRARMLERSASAEECLNDMVKGLAEDMSDCVKETGSELDPLGATGYIQQNIALTMPLDQVVAVFSEAIYRLALQVRGNEVAKAKSSATLFLPNGSQSH